MRISDLTGPALDWAVAKCENPEWSDEDAIVNVTTLDEYDGTICNYSTDWAQGGPIIEREGMHVDCLRMANHYRSAVWEAWPYATGTRHIQQGSTPLIAAMRCFVASKLGDEVDVPEELQSTEV